MKINHSSPIPIYEQLVLQIIQLIESGELKSDEALPSVRRLAKQIGVANNTIVKSYTQLEAKGYIKSYGNKGAFVLEQQKFDENDPLYFELVSVLDKMLKKGIKTNVILRVIEDYYQ